MNRFLPPMIFYGTLFGFIFIGIIAGSNTIAKLAGGLLGISLDPIVLVGGLIIGWFVANQKNLIAISIAYGLIASIIVSNINNSFNYLTPPIVMTFCIAVLFWAYITNTFRLIRVKDANNPE